MTLSELEKTWFFAAPVVLSAVGMLAFFVPRKVLGKDQTSEEQQRKRLIIRLCGIGMVACGFLMLLLKVA